MRSYRIERVAEDEWARWRDMRLEMVADTPLAFMETYEDALRHDEGEWRFQARRAGGGVNRSAGWVAVDPADGRWVGTMSVFEAEPGVVALVGVYVAPAWRGPAVGVTDALLSTCERWAREQSARVIRLLVHEDNPRAAAFYARAGFRPTGHREPYALDPAREEIEMELALP